MIRVIVSALIIMLQGTILSICFGQGLRPGDKLSVKVLRRVINTQGDSIDLSKNRPPLTILDFWGTGCSGCIRRFAMTDSIQREFAGQVRIVMINRESKDSTIRFFKRRSKLNFPSLSFVSEDKELNILFPHRGVPFYVWLDQNLRVIANSGSNLMDSKTIKGYLADNKVIPAPRKSSHVKISPILNYEYEKEIQYSSMITRCIIGTMPPAPESFNAKTSQIAFSCSPIESLYKYAYSNGNPDYFGEAVLFFRTKDSSIIKRPKFYDKDWSENHRYGYKLILPKALEDQKFEFMKDDLNGFFGYQAINKKITRKCLVLDTIKNSGKWLSKGGKFKSTFNRTSIYGDSIDSIRAVRNGVFVIVLNSFRVWFTETKPGLHFVNNTGIDPEQLVDISISAEAIESMDLKLLNRELAAFDLKIVERDFEIDVVVIDDKPAKSLVKD